MIEQALTREQRAFVCGDEGICPACQREVEWADVDTNLYICKTCLEEWMSEPVASENTQDAYILGQMDAMGPLLKSVLTTMVEQGDPALTILRDTLKEVEAEKNVKLR